MTPLGFFSLCTAIVIALRLCGFTGRGKADYRADDTSSRWFREIHHIGAVIRHRRDR